MARCCCCVLAARVDKFTQQQLNNISVVIPKLDGIAVIGHTVDVGTIYDDANGNTVVWKVGAMPGKAIKLKAKVKVSDQCVRFVLSS